MDSIKLNDNFKNMKKDYLIEISGEFGFSKTDIETGEFLGAGSVKDFYGEVYTGTYQIFKTGDWDTKYIAVNNYAALRVRLSSGGYSKEWVVETFNSEGLGSDEVKAAFDKKQEENMRAYKLKVHGDADRPLVREYKDLTKSKDESLTDYWGCNIVGM